MFHKALWSLEKRSRRAFRGYPLATAAFYGPNDQRATKVAVGIVPAEVRRRTRYDAGFPKTRMRVRVSRSCARSANSSRLTGRSRSC
jgi:hypothetical protein